MRSCISQVLDLSNTTPKDEFSPRVVPAETERGPLFAPTSSFTCENAEYMGMCPSGVFGKLWCQQDPVGPLCGHAQDVGKLCPHMCGPICQRTPRDARCVAGNLPDASVRVPMDGIRDVCESAGVTIPPAVTSTASPLDASYKTLASFLSLPTA